MTICRFSQLILRSQRLNTFFHILDRNMQQKVKNEFRQSSRYRHGLKDDFIDTKEIAFCIN